MSRHNILYKINIKNISLNFKILVKEIKIKTIIATIKENIYIYFEFLN